MIVAVVSGVWRMLLVLAEAEGGGGKEQTHIIVGDVELVSHLDGSTGNINRAGGCRRGVVKCLGYLQRRRCRSNCGESTQVDLTIKGCCQVRECGEDGKRGGNSRQGCGLAKIIFFEAIHGRCSPGDLGGQPRHPPSFYFQGRCPPCHPTWVCICGAHEPLRRYIPALIFNVIAQSSSDPTSARFIWQTPICYSSPSPSADQLATALQYN